MTKESQPFNKALILIATALVATAIIILAGWYCYRH
jgi:hypothetical protein